MVNMVLSKQAAGQKVWSLAIGEPSFDTPRSIIEVAHRAMTEGETHYTSSYGTSRVRQAISEKVNRKNRIRCTPENSIFLTTKFAVYASLVSVLDKESEVLIPDPGYFYSEPVILAGGSPKRYPLSEGFQLDLDGIKSRIGRRTRAVVINSPSNPTGSVFRKADLRELLATCIERNVTLLSDEAYEDLTYGREHVSIGSFEREPERVVSIFSFSKSYAMTGWRAGYVIAAPRIVARIAKFLENTYTSYPPFIQSACAFALENCDRDIARFRRELWERKRLAEEALESIRGLEPFKAQGAFYLFPTYTQKMSSRMLAAKLLENENVAVLPGTAFGPRGEHHFRISFAGPPRVTEQALERMGSFFLTLRRRA